MSTSLLYHGFGIRGYRYLATQYQKRGIVVRIEPSREALRSQAQPPLPSFLAAFAVEVFSSGRPFFSFSRIFGRSSGSGLRSRACAH